MSDTARIAIFSRYTVDEIPESSTGPMVAMKLYSSDKALADQTPHFEFAVAPDTAMGIGKRLCDVAGRINTIAPSSH